MNDKMPTASLAEVRALLGALPAADPNAGEPAPGPSGLLGALRSWLAVWQGRSAPRLDRPRLAVFLGSATTGKEVAAAQRMVTAFQDGTASAARLAGVYDAELRLHEMAIGEMALGASSDEDAGAGDALSDAACATAMAYGMTAVDDGVDLLCLSAAGPGIDAAATALCAALYGIDLTGSTAAAPGDGGDEEEPLTALRRHGGHALAAAAGAIIAARMGRVPVILDGLAATASAAVLYRLDASILDHCLVGHAAPAREYRRLLDLLDKEPLLDLGIASEDGSGALIALGVLRGALVSRDASDA